MFSWFNSSDQVDAVLVYVAVIGAIVEAVVAIVAVINVHKEIEESRKKKLEKYIEIFACIAAFLFLAEAILGWRSSMLLKADNLKLEKQVLDLEAKFQPRQFSDESKRLAASEGGRFVGTLVSIRWVGQDPETDVFAHTLGDLLSSAGWKVNMDEGWLLIGSGIDIDCRRFADINAAIALNEFLNECGFVSIVSREQTWSDSPDASIIVNVGFKGSKVTVGYKPTHAPGVSF